MKYRCNTAEIPTKYQYHMSNVKYLMSDVRWQITNDKWQMSNDTWSNEICQMSYCIFQNNSKAICYEKVARHILIYLQGPLPGAFPIRPGEEISPHCEDKRLHFLNCLNWFYEPCVHCNGFTEQGKHSSSKPPKLVMTWNNWHQKYM